MTQTEDELLDERTMYRINRLEREKERQYKKHRQKIERTDWISILNEEGGREDAKRNENF